ncbi:DNA-processing protein DprA [Corynebacterium heidelbergense]|uniref:DNA-protecting protein DprA n=1 Tax=Corynebacterium heidelbergense TaxID=2055947 RepID=A0A364VD30_9CORY|nr:DNA-processing protein DprA [Corynebacterium heidelbergense]RAV34476.1 DNA-protecting protein DprA [Corynebacterium heidelbergense]
MSGPEQWGDTVDRREYLAWGYLRRVIEASRGDLLELLWPGGETSQPADVVDVAERIATRDTGLPDGLLQATANRYCADPRQDAEIARRRGMRLIFPGCPEWPRRLDDSFFSLHGAGVGSDSTVRGLSTAPFSLWVEGEGRLDRLVQLSVAMVGTRAPSRYGREVAQQFATELGLAGYSVVSGGALGIDRVCHEAALDCGASSIAVLASGPDVDYPSAHGPLFRRIRQHGCTVSEYPPGVPPARHRFLTRNRLVAGLALGTVVLQAPLRSGALNTANWSEAMVKPTLAVPGPVTSAGFQGCLKYIRDNRAAMAICAGDIREQLEPLGRGAAPGEPELPFGKTALTLSETMVFDACAIGSEAHAGSVSDVQAATGLSGNLVMRTLRDLEKRGYVRREGSRWIKAPGTR